MHGKYETVFVARDLLAIVATFQKTSPLRPNIGRRHGRTTYLLRNFFPLEHVQNGTLLDKIQLAYFDALTLERSSI